MPWTHTWLTPLTHLCTRMYGTSTAHRDPWRNGTLRFTVEMFGYIPALQCDETLYSICAAIHALNGATSATTTSMELMGVLHGARQHDIPSHVRLLAPLVGGAQAAILDIVKTHTIAGFYLAFADPSVNSLLSATWAEKDDGRLRKLLDGSSRTLRANHPLRWCVDCIKSDIARLGRPYWHVAHQLPLSLLCTAHGRELEVATGRHKRWLLPGDPARTTSRLALDEHDRVPAESLSALVATTLELGAIDIGVLRAAVLQRLQRIGVMHDARSVRHERILEWFGSTDVSRLLLHLPGDLACLAKGDWIAGQLWRHKRSHPVRWIVLWSSLEWRSIAESSLSLHDVASKRIVTVDGQLQMFGSAALPLTPDKVQEAFAKASSIAEAMEMLGASRGSIFRWLESDPALRARWKSRLRAKRQSEAFAHVVATLEADVQSDYRTPQRLFGADLRWLRLRAPETYARLAPRVGEGRSTQFDLFA